MIHQSALQRKLAALATFRESDAQAVEKLGRILAGLGEWDMFRINPLQFAEQYGFEPDQALDMFIRGAKLGLFDFEWNMICPSCGSVEHSHAAIHEIEADYFHCTLCNMDTGSELDNQVEVAFSLNPAVATFQMDPYANYDNYRRYFFSENYAWPAGMANHIKNVALRSFSVVEPDGELRIPFEAAPGQFFRLLSIDHHAGLGLRVGETVSPTPQVVDIDLLSDGFSPHVVNLPAGDITLHVHSRLPSTGGMILLHVDKAMASDLWDEYPIVRRPFFTGKMLINNQTFRDLFRVQNLPYDLKLKVSNVTILFTDLKGSTELYDNTGDMVAYNLVQEHFELLKAAAHEHAGAVIKTMGDAIMASFSNPLDGFQAAADMMDQIGKMKARYQDKGYEIGIKVGMHTGPALAVNANESLDYFGQTVNIAARVQGLAQAGEVWFTTPVYEAEGVGDLITSRGYMLEKQTAILKGVRERTTVYKCL